MKNNLLTNKILNSILLLLSKYNDKDLDIHSYRDFRITAEFIGTSSRLFSIYNRRYKIQIETTNATTHIGWEKLLRELNKTPERLIQVTNIENMTDNLIVFTNVDIDEIVGVLKKI